MSSLYVLTGAYAQLQARAEDGEDVSAELAQLDDALELKAERVAYVLRNLSADQEALAAEEKRLAARRRSLEGAEERLRDYLRTGMEAAGLKRIKYAHFSLSLSERTNLVVVDEHAVPAEYVRTVTTTSVDKTALKAALKSTGVVEPGCELRTTNVLTIR